MTYKSFKQILKESNTIKLSDIYEEDELYDESEVLYQWISPEDHDHDFTIHTMQPEELLKLQTAFGEDTVYDAYNTHASREQKKIVQDKIKNFDNNRIVVIANKTLIDGNHHVIAAIKLNKPARYIDIYEEYP